MASDLLERICETLKESGYPCLKKRLDQFTGREGNLVRLMPATVTSRNFDRTRNVRQPFQVIVVRESERVAKEVCEAIAEVLDDVPIESANGSYIAVKTELYTGPEELDLNEQNLYAWHVRFIAEIVQ